jgi:hypothetical protein
VGYSGEQERLWALSLYVVNGQANHLLDILEDVFQPLLPIAVEILSRL